MEFLVAGASAVQVGTATFYDPGASDRLVDGLAVAIESAGGGFGEGADRHGELEPVEALMSADALTVWDVAVLGAGAAGLCAAIARRSGADRSWCWRRTGGRG